MYVLCTFVHFSRVKKKGKEDYHIKHEPREFINMKKLIIYYNFYNIYNNNNNLNKLTQSTTLITFKSLL